MKLALLVVALLLAGCAVQEMPFVSQEQPVAQLEAPQITGFVPAGNVLAGSDTMYLDFNEQDYQMALRNNKRILLVFYASWSPASATEHEHARLAFAELHNADVVGFRVHYKDGEASPADDALALQFDVLEENTKVLLRDGNQEFVSTDEWDKKRYLTELA
jgi:hypothetical protein